MAEPSRTTCRRRTCSRCRTCHLVAWRLAALAFVVGACLHFRVCKRYAGPARRAPAGAGYDAGFGAGDDLRSGDLAPIGGQIVLHNAHERRGGVAAGAARGALQLAALEEQLRAARRTLAAATARGHPCDFASPNAAVVRCARAGGAAVFQGFHRSGKDPGMSIWTDFASFSTQNWRECLVPQPWQQQEGMAVVSQVSRASHFPAWLASATKPHDCAADPSLPPPPRAYPLCSAKGPP